MNHGGLWPLYWNWTIPNIAPVIFLLSIVNKVLDSTDFPHLAKNLALQD